MTSQRTTTLDIQLPEPTAEYWGNTETWPHGWYVNHARTVIFFRCNTKSGRESFFMYLDGTINLLTTHHEMRGLTAWKKLPEGTKLTITIGKE